MPTDASDRRHRRGALTGGRSSPAPTAILAVALAAAGIFIAAQSRRLYFFGDDWVFLLNRQLSWHDLMQPHNGHWSTLPVLAFVGMRQVFGIDHYPVYALMPIVLHIACCILLYALMCRQQVGAWAALAIVVPFGFLAGNIGENPLWDFQVGFLGSASLGLVSIHLHVDNNDEPKRWRYPAGWVTSTLALMCSGMGVTMLLWLGMFALTRRGLVQAAIATAPSAVVYLAWYSTYGQDPVAPGGSADGVVAFTAAGLGNLWQNVVRIPATGGTVLLALTVCVLIATLPISQRRLALSGLLAALAMYLLLGFSRSGMGIDFATASRYAYFGLLFTLPAAAVALNYVTARLPESTSGRALILAVFTGLLVGNGIAQTLAFVDGRISLDPGLPDRIAATELLIDQGGRFLSTGVSLPYNPDITPQDLARPSVRNELADRPVTKQALLDTSLTLQVASSGASLGLDRPTGLQTHGLSGPLLAPGCTTVIAGNQAWLDLPPTPSGSQVQLTSRANSYPAQLLAGTAASEAVSLTAPGPGEPEYVATTSLEGTLRVNLATGSVRVCLGA